MHARHTSLPIATGVTIAVLGHSDMLPVDLLVGL